MRSILILATGEKWLEQVIYDKIVNGIIEKEKKIQRLNEYIEEHFQVV